MLDLATATHEQFAPGLNRRFRLGLEGGESLELELLRVDKRGAFDPQIHKRQPFSLLFRGPLEPVLPQRIYALDGEPLGALELFLVPVGPDREGMCYEAVIT